MRQAREAEQGSRQGRLALLLLIVLLPALAISATLFAALYLERARQIDSAALQTARALSQAFDSLLGDREARLEVLALSPYLAQGPLAAFHRQASAAVGEQGAIALVDADGQQLLNTVVPWGSPLPRTGAPALVAHILLSAQPAFSGLFMGTATRRPVIAVGVPVTLAAPQAAGARARAVLLYGQPVAGLQQILARQRLPAGYEASLLDRAGRLLACSGPCPAPIGAPAQPALLGALAQRSEGRLREDGQLLAYRQSARSGWTVMLRLERGLLRQNMAQGLLGTLVIVLAALAGGAAMAWRYNLSTLRSLDSLCRAAASAAAGHWQTRASLAGPPEITALARQFNAMISAREAAEQRLALAASVFEAAAEGVMLANAAHVIIDVNPAFLAMSGYARHELLGQPTGVLRSGRHGKQFYAAMWTAIEAEGHWSGQLWDRRRDGSLFAAQATITRVAANNGAVSHYIALFTDITAQRLQQDEMERVAYTDPLTRLPNRRLLGDRIEQALARAERVAGLFAVCTIDLDGFKAVNDEQGHEAGDLVLMAVAQRLHGVVRAQDTVARVGGDEFVLLLADLEQSSLAEDILARALQAVSQPIPLPNGTAFVSASIGLAFYPQHGRDADALLRVSDRAMYAAKRQGRNRFVRAPWQEPAAASS